MGISFVSKVAPPKYKGMMMGCWFAATAVGNYATSLIGYLWGSGMALWMDGGSVLIVLCLLGAVHLLDHEETRKRDGRLTVRPRRIRERLRTPRTEFTPAAAVAAGGESSWGRGCGARRCGEPVVPGPSLRACHRANFAPTK